MPDHKLFIDECLSPSLVRHAVAAGYYQTTCVRDRGLSGTSDAKLVQLLVQEDFILVTHNSCDFRGVPPGTGGLYAQLAIHAGLVCLNSEALQYPALRLVVALWQQTYWQLRLLRLTT